MSAVIWRTNGISFGLMQLLSAFGKVRNISHAPAELLEKCQSLQGNEYVLWPRAEDERKAARYIARFLLENRDFFELVWTDCAEVQRLLYFPNQPSLSYCVGRFREINRGAPWWDSTGAVGCCLTTPHEFQRLLIHGGYDRSVYGKTHIHTEMWQDGPESEHGTPCHQATVIAQPGQNLESQPRRLVIDFTVRQFVPGARVPDVWVLAEGLSFQNGFQNHLRELKNATVRTQAVSHP